MKFSTGMIWNLLVAANLLALPSMAQEMTDEGPPDGPPPPEMAHGWGGPGCPFLGELGLSDDQLERLAKLKSQFEVSTAAKEAELKAKMQQMVEVMTDSTLDRAKAQALQGQMNALHDDISNSRLSFFLDASSVLTLDQRRQLHHGMLVHMLMGGMGGPMQHQMWMHHEHHEHHPEMMPPPR